MLNSSGDITLRNKPYSSIPLPLSMSYSKTAFIGIGMLKTIVQYYSNKTLAAMLASVQAVPDKCLWGCTLNMAKSNAHVKVLESDTRKIISISL